MEHLPSGQYVTTEHRFDKSIARRSAGECPERTIALAESRTPATNIRSLRTQHGDHNSNLHLAN